MDIQVGLVQYNSSHRHYLPYAVGLLQAYVQKYSLEAGRYSFLPVRVLAAPLEDEIDVLKDADIVAFSSYVWNIQRNLELAKRLKQFRPEILTVWGGPQIPKECEAFLRAHRQVDLCCVGEGEASFLDILEVWPQKNWSAISGLRWLDIQGNYCATGQPVRRKNLNELPSPYLEGTFEDCFQRYPEVNWSALWETNRGCPFSCSFCDWGSATASKVYRFDEPRLQAELEWFADKKLEFVFCCDANFGILPRDVELAKYAAMVRKRGAFPRSLVVQNAKNASHRTVEIHRILAQAGLDTHATLSLQSLHPPTLKASGRENISLQDFSILQKELQNLGIGSYTDIILGLPEETYQSFTQGVGHTIESGQYQVIHLFTADILPNAPMADSAYQQKYGLKTIRVPAVGFHTPVQEDPDGIIEYQNLVIATRTMPEVDWVRARAFISMTQLLLFKPGTLRLPLLILQHAGNVPMTILIERFLSEDLQRQPVLSWVRDFFLEHAQNIQLGQPEHVPGQEPDGQWYWWSINEALLEQLVRKSWLAKYYTEAEQILKMLWKKTTLPKNLLDDCLFYAASLQYLHLKQDLFGLNYQTQWNAWAYYQALLGGQSIELSPQQIEYRKDWQGAPFQIKQV